MNWAGKIYTEDLSWGFKYNKKGELIEKFNEDIVILFFYLNAYPVC